MSAVKLIDDINDKIIREYINDYPTFRRFLLTLGNDRELISQYIRRYLPRFISDNYIDEKINTQRHNRKIIITLYDITIHKLNVWKEVDLIPFDPQVTYINFHITLNTVENLSLYLNIETVYIRSCVNVSPDDFVRVFPKLHTLYSENTKFIEGVLAISKTIKKVLLPVFTKFSNRIAITYPNIEFIKPCYGVYELANTTRHEQIFVKNFKCEVFDTIKNISEYYPEKFIIETFIIATYCEYVSQIVIPNKYENLRFLMIEFDNYDHPNSDIVIDGFPLLEFIAIRTIHNNSATCRIANVPYIFYININKSFNLDIDYETVSIFERAN